jgi:hypothetical protein
MGDYDRSSKWPILLAVTQVLSRLRFDANQFLSYLGGRQVMIESPLIAELKEEFKAEGRAEGSQETMLTVLKARFGEIPEEIASRLHGLQDESRLQDLATWAAICPSIDSFRERLSS